MSYEPRGKVKALIDAMRAAAVERPVWTSVDVAKVLETSTNAVPAFVDPSIRHGMLFRKLENGRSRYSLKPFAAAEPPPAPQRETTATGWKPPQMACTRPAAGRITGQVVVQERRETAGDAGAAPGADLPACASSQTDLKCLTAASPEAAPVLADASIQRAAAEPALTIELDAPLDEQQQEEAEPVTWAMWEDGDLDLHGLIELEGGGHRIPAEALARLRKFIAWMPA